MKKTFTSVCILFSIGAFAQIPTNGLVASYPFTGNSNDVSGNNYHLTPFNNPTPTTDRFGNANCAYLMDGINDYFTGTAYGPMGKKSRTINFWAKTAANFNSQGYAVLNYGATSTGGERFEIGLNSSCNGLYLDLGYGYSTKGFNTTDNVWHMYTISYDSTISNGFNAVSFYVDANLLSTYCFTYNPTQVINTQPGVTMNVGRFYSGLPRYFNGSIDDIHIYNRPLTPGEVITIFNAPQAISELNVISFFDVYPNPVTDKLSIRNSEGLSGKLLIYNSIGKLVCSKIITSQFEEISMDELSSGVYFLRFTTAQGSSTRKIVKE